MEEYVSNSLKSKEQEKTPEKKVEKPVIQAPVKTRKKGELRKFSDVFISEDASNVKSYILQDVLLPTLKDTISNIIKSSVDMVLFGETRKNDSNRNQKLQANLFIILFQQINVFIEEIERLNKIILDNKFKKEQIL